ncbi:hypothetical protein Daus18300_005644 [Diaporthe australafricana]|uniref:Extracellular metalloproteinase n=1 Tax=Diaporthe australafricana TaxID=127596 RepID=A0ABR3WZR2_9PEZI
MDGDRPAGDDENGPVPYYVQAAALQVQKTVPNATFRIANDYYIGTNMSAMYTVNKLLTESMWTQPTSVSTNGNTINPLSAFESAVKLLYLQIEDTSGGVEEKVDSGESYMIHQIEGCMSSPTTKLVRVKKDAWLILAWRIEKDVGSKWLVPYIDAASANEVVGVVEYTSNPWMPVTRSCSRKLVASPKDLLASTFGWHSEGVQNYTSLSGNNTYIAVSGATSSKTIASFPSLIVSYPYSPSTADWQTYVNASATHAFYTINKSHDILYALGFVEAAGNFQVSNSGKGGRASNPVEVIIHSSLGTADAETAYRDSVFDSTALLQEYTHGVTVRLVGGPATSGCLSTSDELSLNEGFFNFMPTLLRVKAGDTRNTDYTIADWTTGVPVSLRAHHISTSLETTPLTGESLNALSSGGGYDLATVWATVLYEVFWNLVDTHGIGDVVEVTLDAGGVPQGSRYLMLKLILDRDALIPCSPQHLQAPDAMLLANRILSGGTNQCAIWEGFAKRGFGQDAVRGSGAQGRVTGFAIPSDCQQI